MYVISGQRIAYPSPDTTYEILRECLDKAHESIFIGMYDFTATHVKDLLVNALGRGVRVSLLLNSGNFESSKQEIINELTKRGANVIEVPTGKSAPFMFYHAKVIVIDRMWTLVQSANLTTNSISLGMAGNRDTGIAIESRELADFFTGLLEKDMNMAQQLSGTSTSAGSI